MSNNDPNEWVVAFRSWMQLRYGTHPGFNPKDKTNFGLLPDYVDERRSAFRAGWRSARRVRPCD